MLDFTWELFSETGNVDTYLLFKEIEVERQERPLVLKEELAEFDFPVS
ncbi:MULTISPECIES: YqzL family protein [Bacillaceae]|nr:MULTISPECIES: YqzL family protein [Bacillaceae]PJN90850.1 YqzL family protein [Bacillus sp. mrc49]